MLLKKRKNFEVKFDHEDRRFNPTKSVVFCFRYSFDLNFCKKVLLLALNHNYWWPKYGAKIISQDTSLARISSLYNYMHPTRETEFL